MNAAAWASVWPRLMWIVAVIILYVTLTSDLFPINRGPVRPEANFGWVMTVSFGWVLKLVGGWTADLVGALLGGLGGGGTGEGAGGDRSDQCGCCDRCRWRGTARRGVR